MRKALLLLTVFAVVLPSSLFASGDATWVPLAPDNLRGGITAQVIAETGNEVILEFDIPGFSLSETPTDHGTFSILDVQNCGRTITIGEARLPVCRKAVEIPQHALVRVEVIERITSRFNLSDLGYPSRIYPVQAPVEKLPGARESAEFAISEEFYASSGTFPVYQARIAETGQMRGHRFAMVEVAPVSYIPADGIVEVTSRIRIKVTTTGADYEATRATINRYATPAFEQAAARVLLNYQAPSDKAVPDWPAGYLIITDPDFYDEMQPLAAWKNSKGYQTTVTSTADVPGGVTTTTVKNYIKDAWQTWDIPPAFVLLVGDVADIPNFVGVGVNNPATDLYYATMTDPDYIPDLGIGRFSVTSPTEASAIVAKTINYEKLLISGTPWLKKAVFMASLDNYTVTEGTHNYVISNYMDPAGYTSDKLYCYTYSATTQQVRDALNDGRGLAIYSGHGAETYWADGPQFTQSDVDGLTNLDMYPFVHSYSCVTGTYTVGECFAETWIRKIDKAGLAFWGSSVTSYWDEDDVLEKGVFQALFDDGLTWISGMLDQGKWYLYEHYSGGGDTQRYYEMYNIIGDPSIDIWTDIPAPMSVSHNSTCPVGAGTYAVNVGDAKGPLADALVCLDMPGEVYETAYTDINGDVTLILDPPPTVVGEMTLTVTCHNFGPEIDLIDVVVPAIVTVVPDTIVVETPTLVTVTVLDTLSQPMTDVVVTIDGWGIEPALVDTTDLFGQTAITVDAPYGEILTVVGRQIGETYDCFEEAIVVIGASTLPGPQVEARVDDVGLVGALTPYYEGVIIGRSSHTGLDMFAAGCGVDAFVSSSADTALLEVTPTSLGTITVVLSYPGYEIYEGSVPVIEAYGTLSGTVRDVSTGDSLAGVAVSFYTAGADTGLADPVFETTSGAGGSYAAPDSILVGPYDVYAVNFGYLAFDGSAMVYVGANVYDIDLTPAPSGVVSGTVTETGTGRPITATIKIYRSDDMSLYSETSSDSLAGGAYTTAALPYFTYLFRVSAPHLMTQNIYVTVDEATEIADVEMVPTEGNLLVIDDDTGDKTAAKQGHKGEWLVFDGIPTSGAEKSASIIAADLTDLGYDVTIETSAATDPGTWPLYDVVIWSAGDDTQPVSVGSYRSSLNAYAAGSGKLLIEGGEIGYDAASYPGYPNFADTTLHVVSWAHDCSGNLTLAQPTHPIATIPNPLTATMAMTCDGYGDQDALIPEGGVQIVFDWSTYTGQGGVLVYDDNADPASSQIVFYSFDYDNVTDTAARKDLLENTVAHLLAEESSPDGSISGNVELSGQATYEGVIVTTSPGGLSDTTDASGDYVIDGLYDGTYSVTASKTGFGDSSEVVVITGGATVTDVDFKLYPVFEYMDSPELAIPDNNTTGIRAYIDVTAGAEIASVDCYVDITHSYKGDLIVELKSPEGTTVRLHNRTGSSADNIITWYDIETSPDGPGSMSDFVGEWSEGQWEIWVSDQAGGDTGTLHTWGLRIGFPPSTAGQGVIVSDIPAKHFLAGNRPNPFGQLTRLQFGLPRDGRVELAVYDVAGRRITVLASGQYPAGVHTAHWDGKDSAGRPVASGIYFCHFRAEDFTATRSLVLMK
ncbi:MAG: C25 family cysteine peptidase [Candidatus Eisenbacteria bacterium]